MVLPEHGPNFRVKKPFPFDFHILPNYKNALFLLCVPCDLGGEKRFAMVAEKPIRKPPLKIRGSTRLPVPFSKFGGSAMPAGAPSNLNMVSM
jgi:hypothetical protein